MLLGIWKNFEELENDINLSELEAIVKAAHEREYRHHKFMAGLKGVNLDEGTETAKDIVERKKAALAAQAAGKSEEQMDLEGIGLEVETVE